MRLSHAWGIICHLDSVNNNEAMRAAKNEVLPLITEFYSSITLNDALWKRVKELKLAAPNLNLDQL